MDMKFNKYMEKFKNETWYTVRFLCDSCGYIYSVLPMKKEHTRRDYMDKCPECGEKSGRVESFGKLKKD